MAQQVTKLKARLTERWLMPPLMDAAHGKTFDEQTGKLGQELGELKSWLDQAVAA